MARLSKDRSLPIEMSDQKVEDKRKDDECRVYGRDRLKERLTTVQVFFRSRWPAMLRVLSAEKSRQFLNPDRPPLQSI